MVCGCENEKNVLQSAGRNLYLLSACNTTDFGRPSHTHYHSPILRTKEPCPERPLTAYGNAAVHTEHS